MESQKKYYLNRLCPFIIFALFAVIGYFVFEYATFNQKHIDGTNIELWEKILISLWVGFIALGVYNIFFKNSTSGNVNEDGFDYTGGAGGIM